MSILDVLFSSKGKEKGDKNLIQSQFLDEINTIILVLENLDYLDKESIKRKLEGSGEKISPSIFDKLNIESVKDRLPNLSNYYPFLSLGYGKEATKKLKASLENQSVIKYDDKNEEEVKDELIKIANNYIKNYQELLLSIEKEIREYKTRLKSENDIKELTSRLIIKTKERQLGYPMDLENEIIKMSNILRSQKYGGYSDKLIEEFKATCKKEIETRRERNMTSYEILSYIEENIFSKKLAHYKQDVEQTEKQLNVLNNTNMPDSEKEIRKEMIILNLKSSYGHEMSINKTISESSDRLFAISTKEVEDEFKNEASLLVNKLKSENKDDIYIVAALNVLYKEYANKDMIMESNKRESIEEYIESLLESLRDNEEYSYGEEAISEFRKEFKNLAKSTSEDKKELLRLKCDQLKQTYKSNKEVFIQWKEDRLKAYTGNDKEGYSKYLDTQIAYMLSLSPSGLIKYYEKDNNEKKQKMHDHNLNVALKYLARREYQKTKDKVKYNETLKEIKKGKIPFTEEEIEDAELRVEMLTLFDEGELGSDEKVQETLDYIESTLFKQMREATQNITNKNKHKKI